MTAADFLRNAAPPADDGLIDKAIAELDVRIFEWVDALKSAQTQIRTALAPVKAQRPSARLFEDTSPPSALSSGSPLSTSLSAAAAAAHIPSSPMPAEWSTPPAAAPVPSAPGMPAEMPWPSQPSPFGGHGLSSNAGPSQAPSWPEPPAQSFRQGEGGASPTASTGVMQWPSTPASTWPSSPSGAGSGATPQALEWPTWTPTDPSAPASSSSTSAKKAATPASPAATGPAAKKAAKGARPVPEGPSPEERAQKAAAEEALLSELEDAIARRVRLLRRLDPDTPIEKLIDKARQGQAEASSQTSGREDKSSSWWRRK